MKRSILLRLAIFCLSIMLLPMNSVFAASTDGLTDDILITKTSERDQGETLSVTSDLVDTAYSDVPAFLEKQFTGVLPGALKAALIYDNDYYQIYSLLQDGEKAGWYIVDKNGFIEKFDHSKHAYVFTTGPKISDSLQKTIDRLTDDEQVMIQVIARDLSHDQVMRSFRDTNSRMYSIYNEGLSSLEKDTSEFTESGSVTANSSLMSEALIAKRRVYEEAYATYNSSIISSVSNRSQKENGYSYREIFSSKYAPLSIISANKKTVLALAEVEDVSRIELYEELKTGNSATVHHEVMQADTVMSLGYKGSGVKVGIFESDGVPNASDSELTGRVTNRYSSAIDNHASMVAQCLAGKTYGTAPAATLYCTYNSQTKSVYDEIEWLLGNGVSIINMSLYFHNTGGTYNYIDQYIDHIAMQHDVHVVVAAGNNNGGLVPTPAMSYNSLVVGNFDDKNTTSHTDDIMNSTSCYIDYSGNAEKPDLVAPGTSITTAAGTDTGTSFSAPFAAGIMAEMISLNSSLATKQTAMKAILAASAFRKVNSNTFGASSGTGSKWLSDVEGAGKIDAKNAKYIIDNARYTSGTLSGTTNPIYTKTFSVNESSSQIRVALHWLKKNTYSSSTHGDGGSLTVNPLTDFDLSVYDPNGVLVGSSTSVYSNVEIVEFDPIVSGTYRIEVRKYGTANSSDSFGLAWW